MKKRIKKKSLGLKLKAVDFFCGAGGVTCGFKQVGIKVLGGIDLDDMCKETYENNNKCKFINEDISTLPRNSLETSLGISRKDDNLIFIGCSPCQYYTNLKTDKASSKKSRLLLEDFQEFVEYYLPGFVFIENVPGLKTKGGSPLGKFKKFLESQGYAFCDGVLNAKFFGVPQNRRRYVLIATRLSATITLPEPDRTNIKTVRDSIGNLEEFPKVPTGYIDPTGFQHTTAKLSSLNMERIKATPKNGGDRRSWSQDTRLQLECYRNHSGHYDVYGRMKWEKPSPAITTRFCSLSNGRYGHPEQDRAISLREGATLQSFPTNYTFYAESQGAIAKMVGNAVPPELAKSIGSQLLKIVSSAKSKAWQNSKRGRGR